MFRHLISGRVIGVDDRFYDSSTFWGGYKMIYVLVSTYKNKSITGMDYRKILAALAR
jgi:hypothetical protein